MSNASTVQASHEDFARGDVPTILTDTVQMIRMAKGE